MAKRGRIFIATLTVALLVFLVWVSLPGPTPEPAYEGKLLSDWLIQLEDSDSQIERDQAAQAVRHIGTNAIPTLLLMLHREESPFKSKFVAFRRGWYNPFAMHFWTPPGVAARAQAGFNELGPDAAVAVPELKKTLDDNLSRESVRRAAAILGNIGPEAKAAVPSLLRTAVSTNTAEHFYEFDALGKIHADADLVVPVLIEVMSNSSADRMYAVAAVRQFRGEARSAVPELVALLNDPSVRASSPKGSGFVSDRSQVERALEQIDPETYARVLTNTGPASIP